MRFAEVSPISLCFIRVSVFGTVQCVRKKFSPQEHDPGAFFGSHPYIELQDHRGTPSSLKRNRIFGG